MAKKQRYIDTYFWPDEYIHELQPLEKLLFIYFLTNPSTHICGIYKIPMHTISYQTRLDENSIKPVLSKFEADMKMKYADGWIAMRNAVKHQSRLGNVVKGILNGLKNAPKDLVAWASKNNEPLQEFLRPFKDLQDPSSGLKYFDFDFDFDFNFDSDRRKVETDLYNFIDVWFLINNESFYRDGKESKCISDIIKRLQEKDIIVPLLKKYHKLVTGKHDKFWSSQPMIPSSFLALLPRIQAMDTKPQTKAETTESFEKRKERIKKAIGE